MSLCHHFESVIHCLSSVIYEPLVPMFWNLIGLSDLYLLYKHSTFCVVQMAEDWLWPVKFTRTIETLWGNAFWPISLLLCGSGGSVDTRNDVHVSIRGSQNRLFKWSNDVTTWFQILQVSDCKGLLIVMATWCSLVVFHCLFLGYSPTYLINF